jgi:hypothetical protein
MNNKEGIKKVARQIVGLVQSERSTEKAIEAVEEIIKNILKYGAK